MSDPVMYGGMSQWAMFTGMPTSGGRSPDAWEGRGSIAVPAGEWFQLAGPKVGRQDFTVVVTGPNSLEIAHMAQPPNPGIPLGSNGTITITSEGEVWVYSTAGTEVAIVDTYWHLNASIFGSADGMFSIVGAL